MPGFVHDMIVYGTLTLDVVVMTMGQKRLLYCFSANIFFIPICVKGVREGRASNIGGEDGELQRLLVYLTALQC